MSFILRSFVVWWRLLRPYLLPTAKAFLNSKVMDFEPNKERVQLEKANEAVDYSTQAIRKRRREDRVFLRRFVVFFCNFAGDESNR